MRTVQRLTRSGVRLLAIGVLPLFLACGAPSSALAGLTWSGPSTVANPGTYSFNALACVSTAQCTAVDQSGLVVTFSPTSPKPGTPVPIASVQNPGLYGMACVATTQCTAVGGGQAVTFNPSSPATSTPVSIGVDSTIGSYMTDVACPSATQCTAVDQAGRELTFNPTSPGTPTPVTLDGGTNLLSVACVSVTQCTTVGYDGPGEGQEITFNPQSPGTPTPIFVDYEHNPDQVVCVAQTQCTVVDVSSGGGHEVTFDPTAPGTPTPVAVESGSFATESGGWFFGLACLSASDCVATDAKGNVLEGDPTSASPWTLTPIDPAGSLVAIACLPGWCAAVDNSGNAFVGSNGSLPTPPALTGSGPSISGTATLGQTLTESHGAWSNSPTSYLYQWEQCDSAGRTCSLIAGATSRSYTIQAGDVGHTLRVREIAANVAGQGNPALSAPTVVVLGASSVIGTLSVRRIKASGSRISVTIGCTGGQGSRCTATLALTSTETIHAGKVVAVTAAKRPKRTTLSLGRMPVTINAGSSEVVTLSLNGAGRRLLATRHQLPATLTITDANRIVDRHVIVFHPTRTAKGR